MRVRLLVDIVVPPDVTLMDALVHLADAATEQVPVTISVHGDTGFTTVGRLMGAQEGPR